MMKPAIFATAIILLTVMPARAEDPVKLPEIIVGAPPNRPAQPPGAGRPQGPTAAAPGSGSTQQDCKEGPAGAPPPLSCLNQKLKSQVDRVNPVTNVPPIDAKSSDLKVGVVNIPAVQQQYGRNFGVSAIPYRPPAPVFTTPLGRR